MTATSDPFAQKNTGGFPPVYLAFTNDRTDSVLIIPEQFPQSVVCKLSAVIEIMLTALQDLVVEIFVVVELREPAFHILHQFKYPVICYNER